MSIIEKAPTKTINALHKKGIYTDDSLVRWLPRKYKDYRRLYDIENCPLDHCCAVRGTLRSVEKKVGARPYLHIKIEPESGRYFSVLMFSRVFLYNKFCTFKNLSVVVTGKVTYNPVYGYSMSEPDNIVREMDFVPRIETVYPKVGGVSDDNLRSLISQAVFATHEPFEWELMQLTGVMDYASALQAVHFPERNEDLARGKGRLLYNDLLYFAMGLKKTDVGVGEESVFVMGRTQKMSDFLHALPFELTADQKTVLREAVDTCSSGRRLNTLLQGDVGSGKTVVALALMILAAENGYQSVLMAPRGVLAKQHYDTFVSMTGRADEAAYLHSGMKVSERRAVLKRIADGSVKFVIGTHSCISADVVYKDLGLVVTDEEHLFGVEQKERIVDKARAGAHVLSMSATPIPRTIASVLYGESKEIKTIKTKPAGRLEIKTGIASSRAKPFAFMLGQIREGRQCYVVCPAIDDNENTDILSIESVLEDYHRYFDAHGVKIAVANGRMPAEESAAAVDEFVRGEANILISTTVIEVGVNVPNATVMLIEQAERFGLASLHQLRGRVGRSSYQSWCILRSEEVKNERLQIMCETTDGFKIAEEDLRLRGTGDLLGVKQAGMNKYIDLMLAYPDAFKKAQKVADFCLENGFGQRFFDMCEQNQKNGEND